MAYLYFFLPSVFESMLVSSKISHNWTVGFLKRRISPVSLCGMRMNLMTCLKKNHLEKKKVFFCCYFLFLYDVLDFHVHVVRFLFLVFLHPHLSAVIKLCSYANVHNKYHFCEVTVGSVIL